MELVIVLFERGIIRGVDEIASDHVRAVLFFDFHGFLQKMKGGVVVDVEEPQVAPFRFPEAHVLGASESSRILVQIVAGILYLSDGFLHFLQRVVLAVAGNNENNLRIGKSLFVEIIRKIPDVAAAVQNRNYNAHCRSGNFGSVRGTGIHFVRLFVTYISLVRIS
ncbi:MAG: hypothetical protein J5494_03120 [Candidatus Methanomethylophilaceae archaeon]|nr:hypothetical protein [Candidatus Methanomethylophilaceae archaeon]